MSRSGSNVGIYDEERAEVLTHGLARLVCRHKMLPRSVCDGSKSFSLSQIMCELDPRFESCLDFETLERNCLKLYDVDKDKVKKIFSELGGRICLCVDTLVDVKQKDQYLCLSAQFINNDWKLKKWIIKFFSVSDLKNIPSVEIMKALKEYNIDNNVLSLTVGGTTDLADIVKEEVQKQSKLPMDGQLFHVQCCCDIISQIVKKGFDEIDEIIGKVKLLSWSQLLPLWYLVTSNLSDALKKEALGKFKSRKKKDLHAVPSEKEWGKVRSVCKITERIHDIIRGLFEMKRPTANLFLPHLQEIRAYLTEESTNSDVFMSHVAQKMLEIFNNYWNDMCLALSIAAFLDPRYKLKFVELFLSDLEAVSVLENIRKIYDGYAVCDQKEYLLSDSSSESGEDEDDDDEEEEIEGSRARAKKNRCKILENLNILKQYCQSIHGKPQKSDLDMYLEEPTLPWTEHFSVLNWWKDNCYKYPQLSKMARDFLAIPMSVASSDGAYYTEPREVDWTVMSLKPKLMNALMCTRSWKFDYKQ
ncbi:Zinc finger BED domain-containing protein RICESLEEPER 2 [Bienertia sinuspersici]